MSEELKAFSKGISSVKKNDNNIHYPDDELIKISANWDVVRLFLELTYQSQVPALFGRTQLNKLHQDYETESGNKIDLEELLNKQWLRIIWNEIKIPATINEAIYQLKDLDSEKQIAAFIKDNREELKFIKEVHEQTKYSEKGMLIINTQRAKSIIKKYRIVYPSCPAFDEFETFGFFKKIDNETERIKLCIEEGKLIQHRSISIKDKAEIAGRLWEKMIDNALEEDYQDILRKWVRKVSLCGLWSLDEIEKYVKKENLKILQENARKLILDTEDLKITDKEIDKYWWDVEARRISDSYHTSVPIVQKLDNSTHFNLLCLLNNIEDRFQNNIVIIQETRAEIGFLINLCIRLDSFWNSYSHTKELLSVSLQRPYVLYETMRLIGERYPEAVPFLLADNRFASLGMRVLLKIELKNEIIEREDGVKSWAAIEKLISELWLRGLEFIFIHGRMSLSDYNLSEVIVEVFRPLLDLIYRNSYRSMIDLKVHEIHIDRYNKGIKLLEKYKHPGNHSAVCLFANYIDKILEATKNHAEAMPAKRFEKFPLQDFTFLTDILKIYTGYTKNIKFNADRLKYHKIQQRKIISYLFQLYEKALLTEEIEVYNHKVIVESKVEWYSDVQFLEHVPWKEVLTAFEKHDMLEDFFDIIKKPYFKGTKNKFDKVNIDIIYRIRFHLSVLIAGFDQLQDSAGSASLSKEIKRQIIRISSKYNKFNPPKQLDIFKDDSRAVYYSYKSSLLKEVFQSANLFSVEDKKKLIQSFVTSNANLNRFLVIHNTLLSESDKDLLKKEIGKINFGEYIKSENVSSVPEVEVTLIETVNSGFFSDRAEEILEFYQSFVNEKDIENKKALLFEIQLIIAYQKKDEAAIKAVESPLKGIIVKREYYEDRRDFLLGSLKFNNDKFIDALEYFDRITTDSPNKQMGRLATFLEIAKREVATNREKILENIQEKYDNFTDYEKQFKQINQYRHFNENWAILLKLKCCAFLNNTLEFKTIFYNELNEFNRIQEDFLKIAIPFFAQSNEEKIALDLLLEAVKYYSSYDTKVPFFIKELQKQISPDNTPEHLSSLKKHLKSVMALSLENRIWLVPQRINEYGDDLGKFLLFEICEALHNLLGKIKAIENNFTKITESNTVEDLSKKLSNVENILKKNVSNDNKEQISIIKMIRKIFNSAIAKNIGEDEFTDLFETVLNAQLKTYDIWYESQRRWGASGSGKTSGEVDLGFTRRTTDVVIEAVRVYPGKGKWSQGKSDIKKHLRKSFNYAVNRRLFYNVVYYQNDSFLKHWEEFMNEILPKIKFPSDFSLINEKPILEMADFRNTSIKVVLSKHSQGLHFYHIFVNMQYIEIDE